MEPTSDPRGDPPAPEPAAQAEDDELEDSAEVRAALGKALSHELEGGHGVRYFVYLVIAAVVVGFVAMFYVVWHAIGR